MQISYPMLVCYNALIGADKTAEQIGFKAIIKYNKLDFYAFAAMQKPKMQVYYILLFSVIALNPVCFTMLIS